MTKKKKFCYGCKSMTRKNKRGRPLYYCKRIFEETGEMFYLCNIPIIPNCCPRLKKNEHLKQYYLNNKDKMDKRSKNWRKNNHDYRREYYLEHDGKNRTRISGRIKSSDGYIIVLVDPTSPFFSMKNKYGYVKEHRLVMAKYLERCLAPEELIHHKGIKYPIGSIENKQDNRIINLKLMNGNGEHLGLHALYRKLKMNNLGKE